MRVLAALVAALVVLAGCSKRDDPAGRRTVELQPCRLTGVSAQVRCGTYEVFEDRARQSGRKLKLNIALVPALAAQPEPDPLFILAGGPGQAATDVAQMLMPALERIHRNRDVVFVDQRGTGKSAPLQCELTPKDASISERLKAEFDSGAVIQCRDALSKDHDLRLYTTPLAMDDLDEVRRALGYGRINLWGSSYGTRAALVFMRQHPDAVRTAILDAVAPMALYLPAEMAQDADRALKLLFQSCREDAKCHQRFPDVEAKFAQLLKQLEEKPAVVTLPNPTTGVPETATIAREPFVRILRGLLYRPEATTLVPLTIEAALNGDWRPFIAQADMLDHGFAQGLAMGMFFSVVCTEDVPFIDFDKAAKQASSTFVGQGFAEDIDKTCAVWPKGQVPQGYRDPVSVPTPTLIVSGELDPVTPPRWGEEAHQHLPNSVHIVVPGTGHGAIGNACVRKAMEDFLAKGSVQKLDTKCEASRAPFFTSFAGPPP